MLENTFPIIISVYKQGVTALWDLNEGVACTGDWGCWPSNSRSWFSRVMASGRLNSHWLNVVVMQHIRRYFGFSTA